MDRLTVILPAAGKGQRLDLPYPKEIMRIEKDRGLIDYSFDLFKNFKRSEVNFVVVINEHKTEIVKYLAKYKEFFDISFTYQNPKELEYTGAIKSAKHLFGEYNLVLLPDTVLKLSPSFDIKNKLKKILDDHPFTFLFYNDPESATLKTKGCLRLNKSSLVIEYEDKPLTGLERFNGYWCGFGFRKNNFDKNIEYMEFSTLKLKGPKLNIEETDIFNSSIIQVEYYEDLGTWEKIQKILSGTKNKDFNYRMR